MFTSSYRVSIGQMKICTYHLMVLHTVKDVTGRHIPIPGGHNLIRPPYLPNSNSRQKPRHIPNAGNEGSSAADRMKAVIHIFVTLKACSLALPHHSSIVVVVVLVFC